MNHINQFGWLWVFLLGCVLLSGCCNFHEDQVVMRDGEAYILEKALTREQIQDGNEIRAMQNRVEKRDNGMNSFSQPNAKLIVEPSMAEYVKTNKPKDTP